MSDNNTRINRRRFIRNSSIASVAWLAGCTSETDDSGDDDTGGDGDGDGDGNTGGDGDGDGDSELEISFASGFPDRDDYPTGLLTFEEIVEEESDGSITVNTYPDGQQGDGQEIFQNTQVGGLNMALATIGNLSPIIDELNVKSLPYLFETREEATEMLEGEGWEEVMHPKFRENNLEPMGTWLFDFRWLSVLPGVTEEGWYSPYDGENVRMRVVGSEIMAKTFQRLESNPVQMAWGEVPSALQEGTVEGVHSSSLSHCDLFRDIVEYVTNPNMQHTMFTIVGNVEWYNNLDETHQDVIDYGIEETLEENRGERLQSALDNAISCINEGEAEVREIDSSTREEWIEAVGWQNDFWDEDIERHGMTREEVEEIAQ